LAKAVLFEKRKIELTRPEDENFQTKDFAPQKSKTALLAEELFERLRQIRKEVADQENVRPYIVFHDKTLNELADKRPFTATEMQEISGVSVAKAKSYAKYFIPEIKAFVREKARRGENIKRGTFLLTEELYQKRYSLERIASERNLNIGTVTGHLIKLAEQGLDINLKTLMHKKRLDPLLQYYEDNSHIETWKEVFEHFEKDYEFHEIKIAEAVFREKNKFYNI